MWDSPKTKETLRQIITPIVVDIMERRINSIVGTILKAANDSYSRELGIVANDMLQDTIDPIMRNVSETCKNIEKIAKKVVGIEQELISSKKEIDELNQRILEMQKTQDQSKLNHANSSTAKQCSAHTCNEHQLFRGRLCSCNMRDLQLKIVGLPVTSNALESDLTGLFSHVMGGTFDPMDIAECKRLGLSKKNLRQTVLVTFRRTAARDKVYFLRRRLMKIDNQIYFNEYLTCDVYQRFREVRSMAKENNCKVWTYRGVIYVNNTQGRYRVHSVKDLMKVL